MKASVLLEVLFQYYTVQSGCNPPKSLSVTIRRQTPPVVVFIYCFIIVS